MILHYKYSKRYFFLIHGLYFEYNDIVVEQLNIEIFIYFKILSLLKIKYKKCKEACSYI